MVIVTHIKILKNNKNKHLKNKEHFALLFLTLYTNNFIYLFLQALQGR